MAPPKADKAVQEEPFEKQLWKSADKLRKNIDAAEYKHVVLGLIFLKCISDSFEEVHAKLKAGLGAFAGADPEDKDEYTAENVFFVPAEARWPYLLSQATQPTTYHAWRTGEPGYADVKGFCASVPLARVAELDHVLTPGRYVGLPDEDEDFNFAERFTALKAEFEAQSLEEARLNAAIAENLAKVKL